MWALPKTALIFLVLPVCGGHWITDYYFAAHFNLICHSLLSQDCMERTPGTVEVDVQPTSL